jgi:hypothetical protein
MCCHRGSQVVDLLGFSVWRKAEEGRRKKRKKERGRGKVEVKIELVKIFEFLCSLFRYL